MAAVIAVSADAQSLPARDCVTQDLLCGHHAEATLTGESCRFTSVSRAYGNWAFYGRAGDIVVLEMQSFAFEPLFGLYDP
ncbi:MAG TPA: hypothetical protein VKB93_29260 [Thermoanaerobaculia bacterium]|nr:hypothetical protein [Thermoanaerobaculia bacterium]